MAVMAAAAAWALDCGYRPTIPRNSRTPQTRDDPLGPPADISGVELEPCLGHRSAVYVELECRIRVAGELIRARAGTGPAEAANT